VESLSENGTIEVELTPLEVSEPNCETDELEDGAADHQSDDDDEVPQHQQKRGPGGPRIIRTGQRGRPRHQYQPARENRENREPDFVNLAEIPLKQAMCSEDAEDWCNAIGSKVKSILQHDTWELVDRPDREVIGSRFVLRNKYHSDGTLERKKARLVAKGFAQRPGFILTKPLLL